MELIEKSGLTPEEKRMLTEEYEKVDGMLQTAVNNFQILATAIVRTVSVRKVKKISAKYKELIHTCTVTLIHKFDIKEMENPRIRAAVIKNILGPHSHNYDSFLAWSYLKSCIEVISETDLYEKSITGLLNILNVLYDAARHEETGFEPAFAKALDRDGFYPIKKASAEKRKEITLYVLNKVKEYNNTGVETYKVIFK